MTKLIVAVFLVLAVSANAGRALLDATSSAEVAGYLTKSRSLATESGTVPTSFHFESFYDKRCGDNQNGNPGQAFRQTTCVKSATQFFSLRLVGKHGDGTYTVHTNRFYCWDIRNINGAGNQNGAELISWPCHGQSNQVFTLFDESPRHGQGAVSIGTFANKCITVTNDGRLVQQDCQNPAPNSQTFRFYN